MLSFKAALMFAVCAVASAASAKAQQNGLQTPENAQRFLGLTLVGSSVEWDLGDRRVGVRLEKYTPKFDTDLPLCKTSFEGTYSYTGGGGRYDSHTLFYASLREVRQDRTRVIMVSKDSSRIIELRSESIAARVTYAMEFLRQHCDPSADTGF